jgi:predicted DNA-binding transcriptional regulator YafY
MYQPTTRLLTVLELLQARGHLTGSELSERLEVDARSIRRYITMLQDLGIPVEGVRGPAGGYRLRPGYKLPPLMFTDGEAVALTLALLSTPRLGLAIDPAATNGALAKLERVLPVAVRERVQAVQNVIAVGPPRQAQEAPSDLVAQLSHAATHRQRVVLDYRSASLDSTSRTVDPYGVVNLGHRWYLAGYCHLRHQDRTFRIDRIAGAETSAEAFERPAGVDPLEIVLRSIESIPGLFQVEVILETTLDRARRQVTPSSGRLREVEGGVEFRAQVDDLDGIARYLIGLDVQMKLIAPVELRDAFRRVAADLLRLADA